MAPATQFQASEEDEIYLTALADLASDGDLSSGSDDETFSDEFAFASEDEELFDDVSFYSASCDPIALTLAQEQDFPITSKTLSSGFEPTASLGSNIASHRIRDIQRTLKRSISEETLPSSQEREKPAKLNKSFSEGLDQALSQISLSSETHPAGAASSNARGPGAPWILGSRGCKPWPSSTELDAELEIEEEISKVLDDENKDQAGGRALQYGIRPEILSAAVEAARGRSPVYWSHTLYRGPANVRVQVHYCKNKVQSEQAASALLEEPVLGFDMEWVFSGSQNVQGLKRSVSLIQLGCEDRIALFHIALHDGTTVGDLIAPSLRKVLESDKIIKTGVNILNADAKRLQRFFGIRPRGLIELSNLHQIVDFYQLDPASINNRLVALAKQVHRHLGLPLLKDDVRTSNWGKELDEKQIRYAADDAYAGYMLYRVMEQKRLKMKPEIPRPAFAELRIPLRQQIWEDEGMEAASQEQDEEAQQAENTESSNSKASKSDNVDSSVLDERAQTLYKALCDHHLAITNLQDAAESVITVGKTVLKAIAITRPADIDTLKRVKGVGPVKLNDHGADWIRIVEQHNINWKSETGGAKAPRMLCAVPFDIRKQEYETYLRILKALQDLHQELSKDARFKVAEVPDSTLQHLARLKPSTTRALVLVPGAIELNTAAKFNHVDILEFIKRHAEAGEGRRERTSRTDDSSDEEAFETMEIKGKPLTTRRWKV